MTALLSTRDPTKTTISGGEPELVQLLSQPASLGLCRYV